MLPMRTRRRMGSLFPIPVGRIGASFAKSGLQVAVASATGLPCLIGESAMGSSACCWWQEVPFLVFDASTVVCLCGTSNTRCWFRKVRRCSKKPGTKGSARWSLPRQPSDCLTGAPFASRVLPAGRSGIAGRASWIGAPPNWTNGLSGGGISDGVRRLGSFGGSHLPLQRATGG